MQKNYFLVICLFVFLVSFSLVSVDAAVIFEDDFESGLDMTTKWREDATVSGNWHTEAGHDGNYLTNDLPVDAPSFLIANGTDGSDYSITADMGYGSETTAHPGLVFRYTDSQNFYNVLLGNATSNEFYLLKIVNGSVTELDRETAYPIGVANLWNSFRVDVIGSSISVFLNGTLALSATDSSLSSGEVGFLSNGAGPSATSVSHNFDNFSVDTVPEPSTLLLLGAGLVGVVAISRRKNNK